MWKQDCLLEPVSGIRPKILGNGLLKRSALQGFMKKTTLMLLFILFADFAFAVEIDEIMYNPAGADSGHEWLEIYVDEAVDMAGWKLFEGGVNHAISVYQGSEILEAESFVVIADEADAFLLDYPGYEGTLLDTSWSSLSNSGELLALKDADLNIVDEVEYSSGWGGEEGYSLELLFLGSDNNIGENWASAEPSPGYREDDVEVPEFALFGILLVLIGFVFIYCR